MPDFDPAIAVLLAGYLLVPPALKLASWRLEGFFKGIMLETTVFAIVAFGSFLASFFWANVLGGATLQLFSLITSAFLAFPYWKLLTLIESLTGMGERFKQGVCQQVGAEVSQSIDQLSKRVDGTLAQLTRRTDAVESAVGKIANSVEQENAEASTLAKRVNETLRNWTAYFEQFGNTLEEINKNNLELGKKLEEHQKVSNNCGASPEPARAPPEKPTPAPRRLTTEDGRRARLSGTEWQKKLAERVQELAEDRPIKVDVHLEKGKPDLVLRHRSTGKPLAVGAGKAYTLLSHRPGKSGSSQRTVTREMIVAELKFAKSHRLPLFIVVVNQRTGIQFFNIVPYKELDAFERVTTPSWLADDQPPQEEVERNLQDFIEFLKGLV